MGGGTWEGLAEDVKDIQKTMRWDIYFVNFYMFH